MADAVAKIADKGTITLAAGTYEIDHLVTIDKSVRLVGAGTKQTRIVSSVKEKGILFTGNHQFSASGITFSHEGATPGGAVWVDGGEVRFSDCRFTGATSNRRNYYYEALWLKGSTSGVVESCIADESDAGIGISGSATPVIQECVCASNSYAGLMVYGNGHPSLRHNRCSGNNRFGVLLRDHARVMVQSAQCSSQQNGIVAGDHASGSISYCTCSANSDDGIMLYGHARFVVDGNTCKSNEANGISAVDSAKVTVTDNVCLHNKGVGIGFWGAVSGSANGNTANANGRGDSGGLCIGGHARMTVVGNSCSDNANYGILFRDHARGAARNNLCEGNKYGIIINSPATAKLAGNDVGSNSTQAIGRW